MDQKPTGEDLKNFLIEKTRNLNVDPFELYDLAVPGDENYILRRAQRDFFVKKLFEFNKMWFLKILRQMTIQELDQFVNNFGDEIGPEFKTEWTIMRTKGN